jgi:twitching motility protein PilT
LIVDALLDLLIAQGADALILETAEVPVLTKKGEDRPLSMPPLDGPMLEEALASVEADGLAELEQRGTLRTTHSRSGVDFTVVVTTRGEKRRFVYSRPGVESERPVASAATQPAVASAPPTAPVSVVVDHAPVDHSEFAALLNRARMRDASDIFLSAGRVPRLRVGGGLVEVEGPHLGDDAILALLGAAWTAERGEELARTGSVDLALVVGGTRYRVNVFRQVGGLAAAIRPVRTDAPTLAGLGLPPDFQRLVEFRNGLVLMTGTAGSGKSTTLVALLEHLNRTQPKHIITLEDPIEYAYEPAAAMIHQREVGPHVESFGSGLRAALREAPDVILVGEMRDRDTIAAALTAAETGHLVLSTLHCADAAMAVDRIIDVFPEHQQAQVREQLAGVLRAVVTQMLIPSLQPPKRVVAWERLVVNTAVATKIRERRSYQVRSEIHTGQASGMVPLEVTLANLVRQRRISRETARAYAHDPKVLDEHLR